jgi:cation:H+ antiporter
MEHLIPAEWFEPLHWTLLLLIGGASMYALIKGADMLVEGASGMALRMGMSKVIVGATIVSLGTTSPECAVSVMAAWRGEAGLALGNAVGSIIADTGLIFGVGCLLMALPVTPFILRRQGWVQFGAGAALAGICYLMWFIDGPHAALGRWVGFMFLAALAWYIWASVHWGRQHAKLDELAEHTHEDPEQLLDRSGRDPWWKLGTFFIIGLLLVIVFGHVLIECVKVMAERLDVPAVVISSTIVAFGTSLPELVVGITAIRKGHPALLIGNVIGADILNVLFVIGAAAAASPLPIIEQTAAIPQIFLYLHLPTMMAVLILFRLFIADAMGHGKFRRVHGVILVSVYVAYLALNLILSEL